MESFETYNSSKNNNSSDFTRHVSSTNAKKIAFFIVLGLIIYHGILSVNFSIDSCKWLLSDGRFHGQDLWQPYGCMMHNYSKIDTRMCLRRKISSGEKNDILFIGDSRIRQFFYEFINQTSVKPIKTTSISNFDLNHIDEDLQLNVAFIWCPSINESMFQIYKKIINDESKNKPKFIITSSTIWTHKNNITKEEALEDFKLNLTKLLPIYNKLGQTSQIFWILQHPVIEQRLSQKKKIITNQQIDLFNKVSIDILKKVESDNLKIWKSSRLVSQGEYFTKEKTDGLLISNRSLKISIQMFLNLLCNKEMNHQDGSCCSKPEKITNTQVFIFFMFSTIILITVILLVYKKIFDTKPKFKLLINEIDSEDDFDMKKTNETNQKLESKKKSYYLILFYLARLGIIMFYFYICDRTNFFMKENKYYTLTNFLLPITYLFVHGFFFTEQSRFNHILHKDQTNEWKGWMQLIILTYHITGASKVLSIYLSIRILVSAYLFISGFGHFTYYWKTGDVSLHRFCVIIFRTNLLVFSLCFFMNRVYQFYYFVPLITFWYSVMHLVMFLPPKVFSQNAEKTSIYYFYMVMKFVALMSIITVLYMSEVFFKKIFSLSFWKFLFNDQNGLVDEWWFRWRIDRYSVPAGMIFAFIYHTSKQLNLINDSHRLDLFSKRPTYLALFFSAFVLMVYFFLIIFCPSKSICNEIQPYVVIIPILNFLVLRNLTGSIRTKYSAFFSWFGKISLELFICQYHIWLAADTRGVLVLISSYPVLNVIVTSFIFIFVAHEINLLTKKLSILLIPDDWRSIIRNIFIFLISYTVLKQVS